MPKSKRARIVPTSKVQKKGKEHALKLFGDIRNCADTYPYAYVFAVDNMRNKHLKDIRQELEGSRLFLGKTKVMAKSLGLTLPDEYAAGLSALTTHLHGENSLLFSHLPPTSLLPILDAFHPLSPSRTSTPAPLTLTLPAGVVYSNPTTVMPEDDVPLAHSLEPTIRGLGVPSRLVKGKILLENEYTVCKEGETLDGKQARLLRVFGVERAEFGIRALAWWEAATGEVKEVGDMDVEA